MIKKIYYIIGWEQFANDAVQARTAAWTSSAAKHNLEFCFYGLRSPILRENNYKNIYIRIVITLVNAIFMLVRCCFSKFEKDAIVIISSPPFFSAFCAGFILNIRRISFSVEVRDPYPRTFFDVGLISEQSLFTKYLQKMERFLYSKAKNIIVTDLFDKLPELSEFSGKIYHCLNGINKEDIHQLNDLPFLQKLKRNKELGLINIVSLGRIGMMQDRKRLIVEINEALNSDKIGSVIMIGDFIDIQSDKLIKLGRINSHKIHSYLKLCDVGLNYKARNISGDVNIPIRVYEFLAAGLIIRGSFSSVMRDYLMANGVDLKYFSDCETEILGSCLDRAGEPRKSLIFERSKYMSVFIERCINEGNA